MRCVWLCTNRVESFQFSFLKWLWWFLSSFLIDNPSAYQTALTSKMGKLALSEWTLFIHGCAKMHQALARGGRGGGVSWRFFKEMTLSHSYSPENPLSCGLHRRKQHSSLGARGLFLLQPVEQMLCLLVPKWVFLSPSALRFARANWVSLDLFWKQPIGGFLASQAQSMPVAALESASEASSIFKTEQDGGRLKESCRAGHWWRKLELMHPGPLSQLSRRSV